MIAYKYKLYRTPKTKHLDKMLEDASFVWNHAIALQKRYYLLFKKYIPRNTIVKHFAKRFKFQRLYSQSVQEILERLDTAYMRFFKRMTKRPPKFKRASEFMSVVYKQGGYTLCGNCIVINKIKKRFKFSLSRNYEGYKIKRLVLKRNTLNEYFIVMILDEPIKKYGKSHNGASVGIDFGLKTFLTLSSGEEISSPLLLKQALPKLRYLTHRLSKCAKYSKNRNRQRVKLARCFDDITNKRNDFHWKLAHNLCRRYDRIFLEDLNMSAMAHLWGGKVNDQAFSSFVSILEYVAIKYDVTVHKINRYFPSSKTCECGFIYKELSLRERVWCCPKCGITNHRDLLASRNILRRGIYELKSEIRP